MARTTVTTLVDDLVGGPADVTETLALNECVVELDLSTANASHLRRVLAPYLEAGRPVVRAKASTPRDRTARSPRAERTSQGDNTRLRTWARANGWPDLPDRGRIPDAARNAFTAAMTGALA